MKVRSEVVGRVVTGVYLVCVGVLVYWKRSTLNTLELNAIGDFLAGVFGPIAFLWLVLGYLQQGRELRLSSEALQLQAKELNASVQQQAASVLAQNTALENHEKSLEPMLLVDAVHIQTVNGPEDSFIIKNEGPHARNVTTTLCDGGVDIFSRFDATLLSSKNINFVLSPNLIKGNSFYTLHVFYVKQNGSSSSQVFKVQKAASGSTFMFSVVQK